MSDELHRKYRPRTLKQVHGQKKAVALLSRLLKIGKIPHQLLFVGPSGCGKTTLARILKDRLGCGDRDFVEVNCADFRGIDMIRDIRKAINGRPLYGESRVWLIDEAHKMSGDAQNAILKMLEEPPPHAYIMLATTEPAKLIKTIQTRCTEVQVDLLKNDETQALIEKVAGKEGISISGDAMDKLVEASEGSARKALVILQSLMGIEDEEEQLAAIKAASSKSQAYQIGVELLYKPSNWLTVAGIINKMEDDNWEGIRMLILSMASNILLDPKKANIHPRAYKVIVAFSEPFFNTNKSGLVASCYEAISSRVSR